MDSAFMNGQMEVNTRAYIEKAKEKEKGNCIIQMDHLMMVNGKTAKNMELGILEVNTKTFKQSSMKGTLKAYWIDLYFSIFKVLIINLIKK